MIASRSNITWKKNEAFVKTYLGKDNDSDLNFEICEEDGSWVLDVELPFGDTILSDSHLSDSLSDAKKLAEKINSDFKALYQSE